MPLIQVVPNPDDGLIDRLRAATVGKFEIVAELGRGTLAAVFLAHDLMLDRQVAIKALLPHIALDVGAVVRFRREARFAAPLSHPGIVPTYAIGETLHPPYVVMKFVAGRALDSVLRNEGVQPPALVRAVLQQVGSALDYAHFRNVIHGDVKPANIMLDDDGSVSLTDFGIAKTIDTPASATGQGSDVAAAADQYALGCVAYELLTGKQPCDRIRMGDGMHLMSETAALRDIAPECPTYLADVIHRMIDREPVHRFDSLAAMVHALGVVDMEQQRQVAIHVGKLARSGRQRRLRLGQLLNRVPSPAVRRTPSNEHPPVARASVRSPSRMEKWRRQQRVMIALSLVTAVALLVWSLIAPRP